MKHKNKTQLEVYRAYLRSTNVPELYKVKLYIDYSPERSHWNEVTLFFLEEYRIGKRIPSEGWRAHGTLRPA